MQHFIRRGSVAVAILALAWVTGSPVVRAEDVSSQSDGISAFPSSPAQDNKPSSKAKRKAKVDRSGKPQTGKASFYGKKFYGRKMADGTRMDPKSNVAASKTLPLGTRARVTNLENGKTAVVEIRDRGPFVPGRILDVSPSTADILDMKADGVASVRVTPLTLPDVKGATKTASTN